MSWKSLSSNYLQPILHIIILQNLLKSYDVDFFMSGSGERTLEGIVVYIMPHIEDRC